MSWSGTRPPPPKVGRVVLTAGSERGCPGEGKDRVSDRCACSSGMFLYLRPK